MDRTSLEERVARAKQQAQRWKGEAQRLEGIQRVTDRKQETRRKIWIGAWTLREIEKDPALRAKLVAHLRTVKFRRGEKELFSEFLNG